MDEPRPADLGIDPAASRWIFLGMLLLLAAAVGGYSFLKPKPGPPPAEIAGDSLLVAGREAYLGRCVTCHGPNGRGDGPLSATMAPPKPRDFSGPWKHGETPADVLRVIADGVPGTSMTGWKAWLPEEDRRAVAAYVYYLAGKPVPDALRKAP